MEPRKQAICDALSRFIRQRPGMDPRNYDRAGYLSESRAVTKDRHHAETLLRAVMSHDSITADDLIRASKGAYSGRLTIRGPDHAFELFEGQPNDTWCKHCNCTAVDRDAPHAVRIEYVTGQYFPTEYRRAVCAVLASALWDWTRDHAMPAPCNEGSPTQAPLYPDHSSRTVLSAGDWLRAYFAREFGRGIASRWFN